MRIANEDDSKMACDRTLTATGLSAGYGGLAVVAGVDFALGHGSVLALAGPNGAGKSTLMKVLARQVKPLSGQVCLDKTDIWQLKPRSFARLVAYVPQALDLNAGMTVAELAALGRNPHQPWWSWRVSKADREAVRQALMRTDTWILRERQIGSLSGGERQRALLAMALCQQASFLLLDEPTAHLDFRHQLELCDLILELKAQGLGIVVVLHDLNLIARVADRVVLLFKSGDQPSRPLTVAPVSEAMSAQSLRQVYDVDVAVSFDPDSGLSFYTPTRVARKASR